MCIIVNRISENFDKNLDLIYKKFSFLGVTKKFVLIIDKKLKNKAKIK